MKSRKRKIVWPEEGQKSGTIDGVPFEEIYRQCGKEATAYVRKRFPNLVTAANAEKAEIVELFKKMNAEQKEALKTAKRLA